MFPIFRTRSDLNHGRRTHRPRPALRLESLESRQLMAADLACAVEVSDFIAESDDFVATAAAISNSQLGIDDTGILIGDVLDDFLDDDPPVFDPPVGVGAAIELQDRTLIVHGTNLSDVINVYRTTSSSTSAGIVWANISDLNGNALLSDTFPDVFIDGIEIHGDSGSDRITNDTSIDSIIYGEAGLDTIVAGRGLDRVYGGTEADDLQGLGGTNFLYGQSGNDTLRAGPGDDWMYGDQLGEAVGGQNNDTYVFAGDRVLGDSNRLFDESGVRDTVDFSGLSQGVSIYLTDLGEQQVNSLVSLQLDWTIDDVVGTQFDDLIVGNSDGNHLTGLAGDDLLLGQAGNDRLDGGQGNDNLLGARGDDTYAFSGSVSLGYDEVAEIDGFDTLDFSDLGQGVDVSQETLGWHQPNSLVAYRNSSYADFEQVIGTAFDDRIVGNWRDERLLGNAGNDFLSGGPGNDSLFDGPGRDTVRGGSGADRFLNYVSDAPGDLYQRTDSDDVWINLADGEQHLLSGIHSDEGGTVYDAAQWSARDVIAIDDGLAKLYDLTNNTTLLKQADGGWYTFVRQGEKLGGAEDFNAWNTGGHTVYFTQSTFDSRPSTQQRITIHEIAHTWDDSTFPYWDNFLLLSGWQDTPPDSTVAWMYSQASSESEDWWYLNTASFAREYSRTNPREDFATSFAAYATDRLGMPYPSNPDVADDIPEKLGLIDFWMDEISDPVWPSLAMPPMVLLAASDLPAAGSYDPSTGTIQWLAQSTFTPGAITSPGMIPSTAGRDTAIDVVARRLEESSSHTDEADITAALDAAFETFGLRS